MADKKIKKYDADSIQSLDFKQHCQLRWSMYCNGIEDLFMEVMNNALDQVFNGYGDSVEVIYHKNGAWSIEDNSTGIPIGWNKKANMSTQDSVFNVQSTGAKFSDDSFEFSVGAMGTGLKVTNFLSHYVKVKIYSQDKGEIWEAFYDQDKNKNVWSHKTGKCKKDQHGTYVEFLPDEKYFKDQDVKTISKEFVKQKCLDTSYLFKDMKLTYIDEETKEKIEYDTSKGIEQFITDNLGSSKQTSKLIHIPLSVLANGEKVEIAFSWTNKDNSNIVSFCNLLKMINPGTEVDGFKVGLYEVLQNFANQNKDDKTKDTKFDQDDVCEGLIACINCYLPAKLKLFQGQTKTKLLAAEVKPDIRNLVIQNLTKWLKENKADGLKIIKNIYASRDARKAAERAKVSTKAARAAKKLKISDKYSRAVKDDPRYNTLYCAEGLSAAGSIISAISYGRLQNKNKDSQQDNEAMYSSCLALRGKVISVYKNSLKSVLENEEIQTLIAVIGTGIGDKFDIKKLRMNKIVIFSDDDSDGKFIETLLLGVLYKLFSPQLFTDGHVYLSMCPLYVVDCKDGHQEYFFDTHSKNVWMENKKNASSVKHIHFNKGIGSLNPDVVYKNSICSYSRHIIKVNAEDAKKAEAQLELWLGKDADIRKNWIDNNIDFSKVELD